MTGARRRWPVALCVREGLANARAGGLVGALVVVVGVWVASVAGVFGALDVSRLVEQERRWVYAGGFTYVVEPGNVDELSEHVDAARCDRLGNVDGVRAAFAVASTPLVMEPGSAPGTRTSVHAVSPGAYRFFDLETPSAAGVIVPVEAAKPTGLVDGEVVTFVAVSEGHVRIEGALHGPVRVISSPKLGRDIEGSYLVPGHLTGGASTCYVSVEAGAAKVVPGLLAAVLGAESSPAMVRPRLSSTGLEVDFNAAFDDRVSRWAWVGGGVVVWLLWAVVQRAHRSRFAVYATFGAGGAARLVIQFSEWCAYSLPAGVVAAVLGSAAAVGLGVPAATAVWQVGLQVAGAWLCASVGALLVGLAPIGTILDALKERT